jgi:hypothetical protein|uniref:Uncharacterized protein n=1 Tax=Siphoviridae sp. ctksc2 TaxID=2825645 RepID=A0A8S5US01_9CAUD|nr:MAG TPA: hypothetical protein [Siphoviridae sp. ctksc2]
MTDWPDKPLIRVLDGEVNEDGVADELAYHVGDEAYALISEEHMDQTIVRKAYGDMIVKWEEVTAVPTAALKRLQDAFRGVDVIDSLEPPLLEVLSCLPADKPSPLDTVVKYAKRDDQGSKVDVDRYVARLLRSMPSDAEHPEYLDLLRIAVEAARHLRWCGFLDPWAEIADEAKNLKLPKTEDGRFTLLVKRIGAFLVHRDDDTATDIGAHALAWAAQIIEEEDK